MRILHESNRLREGLCQSLAAYRESTDLSNCEKLLAKYKSFFNRIQHDDTLTTSEIQAVCDLNIVYVGYQLKLVRAVREIEQHLTRTALDWNISHEDAIFPESLVCTYFLSSYIDLTFGSSELLEILAKLDKAVAIAYCEQGLVEFLTVAAVYRLRSRVLLKMGNDTEARESGLDAIRLVALDADYKQVIRRHDSDINKFLRTLTDLP